jgi:16S rRNA (cytidine1402-2'-O)-methyltransferase
VRGSISAALAHFENQPPRGEFVLVIAGYDSQAVPAAAPAADWQTQATVRLQALAAQGVGGSAAAKQVAREFSVPRNEVYALWIALAES